MQHRAVLHVAARADSDRLVVAAHHGAERVPVVGGADQLEAQPMVAQLLVVAEQEGRAAEFAARAGTDGPYDFGPADKLRQYGWFADNAEQKTHPVAQKKPNPWGLFDITGNVAEWTLSAYRAYPYDAAKNEEISRKERRDALKSLVPESFWTHQKAAKKETLLALRGDGLTPPSKIDAA